jgi:hypothetical protein
LTSIAIFAHQTRDGDITSMATLSIEIDEETIAQLNREANRIGMNLKELVTRILHQSIVLSNNRVVRK